MGARATQRRWLAMAGILIFAVGFFIVVLLGGAVMLLS
jgi:hypothetical protein